MPTKPTEESLSQVKRNEENERHQKLNEKRMLDEKEIITVVKKLISESKAIITKASETDKANIISTLITDMKDKLFECQTQCPFCRAPCNETHPPSDQNRNNFCNCHRPQGFSGYHWENTNVFVTSSCNELVETNSKFRNCFTNNEWVDYKNYKSVNSSFASWDIKDIPSDHSKYWKYITYKVMPKLDYFYPNQKKEDVTSWKNITKDECLYTIKNKFHLDQATLTRDASTGHYIIT